MRMFLLIGLLSCVCGPLVAAVDLSRAVVVVRPGEVAAPEQSAARLLAEEIEKRSGIRLEVKREWPVSGAVIAITGAQNVPAWKRSVPAYGGKAEGFRLKAGVEGGRTVVWVSANDGRGALFGVGHLLRQLEGYVEKNFEFYQYCMSGNSFLDAHYFTRSSQGNKSLDRDESFSTGYDTRLAKILANELLKNLVLKLLNRTDAVQPELTWTGSKTDLIELIYALHGAEIFNNEIGRAHV